MSAIEITIAVTLSLWAVAFLLLVTNRTTDY